MSEPGWVRAARTTIESGRARGAAARTRAQATIVWQVWDRMLEIEFVDRSVALAAKAFVSFFPVVIVVAAFMPHGIRTSILTTVTSRLGIHGQALVTARSSFTSANDVRRATGLLGLIFTAFYANSFYTALQRVYLRAWRRPLGSDVANNARGLLWMATLLAFFAVVGGIRALVPSGLGTVVFVAVSFATSIIFWWMTAWLMLQAKVRQRVVLASGVLTGIALTVYSATATLWMPTIVTRNQTQFGFFGVSLALVTWFSGAAICILVGACAAPVLADDPGPLGRLVRGSASSVLVPGAPPSLPAPSRPGLADALRMPSDDS
jgi:membrane protein